MTTIETTSTPLRRAAPRPGVSLRAVVQGLTGRPLPLLGTLVVTFFLVIAAVGPLIAPYDFAEMIRGAARQPPSAEYLFGTDHLGRDVFSRVVYGAREIITIPLISTAISVLLGASLGLLLGYVGGWLDEIAARLLDSLLSIPALVLALVMLGTLGPSPIGIIIVIVLLYTPIVARVVRSSTLALRSAGYVEAARLRGEGLGYILFRELLPGVLPALAVEAALRFSYAIFLQASLGFLGLGVQPPSPDWGRMVNEARGFYTQAPWALWFPSGAIAALVIGVNLLSDGLRRVFRREGQM